MGISISVWPDYRILLFIAIALILIMAAIIGIQSAKAADRKQDNKNKIAQYEKDIADRNRVISKQTQEIDYLKLKLVRTPGKAGGPDWFLEAWAIL